jgi:hypothetical protein
METGRLLIVIPVKPGKYSIVQRKWYGVHPGGGWWGVDLPEGINNPEEYGILPGSGSGFLCPFGQPGDKLALKETWSLSHDPYTGYYLFYKADNSCVGEKIWAKDMSDGFEKWSSGSWVKYHSPATMPQWAVRNIGVIDNVMVKRVQDITEDEAKATGIPIDTEGFYYFEEKHPKNTYYNASAKSIHAQMFMSSYGNYDSNVWVWLTDIRKVD